MEEVKFADLKKAVKEINALKIEGVDTIRTVGIKRVKMEELFLAAIDVAAELEIEDTLSDNIIDINNAILDFQESGESPAEKKPAEKKPAEKKPAEKKPAEKKPAEKKPAEKKSSGKKPAEKKPAEKKPAKKKERSCYDHIVGKQSGNMDEALREGGTMAEIMKLCGVSRTRFQSHLKYLRDTCGLTVLFKADKKDDKLLDHYQIKESSYKKP